MGKKNRSIKRVPVETLSGGLIDNDTQGTENVNVQASGRAAITTYEFHEVANIFPLMEGEEFNELVQDIRENGLQNPIWLHEGKIIDGRNRYRACQEAGVEPVTREWDGKGDLIHFVVSMNLHRRHLNESQRAMVAAKLKPHFEDAAKNRQGWKADVSANLRGGETRKSSEDVGKVVNVSPRSVESATKVLKEGIPDLVEKVTSGDMRLGEAVKIARKAPEEQEQLLSLPKRERSQALKQEHGKKHSKPSANHEQSPCEATLHERLEAAEESILAIIVAAREGGWSELLREAVLECLERMRAAAIEGKDVHAEALRHSLASEVETETEAEAAPVEVEDEVVQDTPDLAEEPEIEGDSKTVMLEDIPETHEEETPPPVDLGGIPDTYESDSEVTGNGADELPDCFGSKMRDRHQAKCRTDGECKHYADCNAKMVEAEKAVYKPRAA
jgi:hypothetical protein